MATLLGSLLISLGLDSGQFRSGLAQSDREFKKTVKSIQATGETMKGIGVGLTAAITLPFTALAAMAPKALEFASSLGEVAQQLGVTTKDLQEYRYAASQAGISQDEMDKGLAKLTRTLGEAAAGSAGPGKAFAALGVSVKDSTGRIKTAGEVIPELANALSKIKDPAARATLEVALFGKAGQKLDTLLAGGAEGINAYRVAAQKLGIVLSDKVINKADETADKFSALKQVMSAQVATIFVENSDAIIGAVTSIAEGIASLTRAFSSLSPETQKMALAGAAIAAALGPVLTIVGGLTTLAAPLIATIGSAGLAASLAAAATAAAPFIAAGAALATTWYLFGDKIGPALQEFGVAIQSALGPHIRELVTTLSATLKELWAGPLGEGIRAVVRQITAFAGLMADMLGPVVIAALKVGLVGVTNTLTLVGDALKTVSRLLQGDFVGAWQAASSAVSLSFGGLPAYVAGIGQRVGEGIRLWFVDKLNAVWDSVKASIEKVKGYFHGMWDYLVGHSIVPDTLDGIEAQFQRLKSVMVDPVGSATAKVSESFRALQDQVRGLLDRLFPEIREQLNYEADKNALKAWMDAGKISADDYAEALKRLSAARNDALYGKDDTLERIGTFPDGPVTDTRPEDILSDFKRTTEPLRKTQDEMRETFRHAFSDGVHAAIHGDLDDFLKDTLRNAASRAFEDAINSLADLLYDVLGGVFGGAGGGDGGVFGTVFKGLFGGFRANGGPVSAGRAYVVGERGPELFMPRSAGAIATNDNLQRGFRGGGTINVTVNGARGNAEIQQMVQSGVRSGIEGYDRVASERMADRARRYL